MLEKEKRAIYIEQHPSIVKWLENFKPNTRERYAISACNYFSWVEKEAPDEFKGSTPEELLDLQDACVRSRERFKQVDLFKMWLRTKKGTYKTKQLIKYIIYSFYACNRVPLPKDRNRVQPTRESVQSSMSINELRDIVLSSNKCYQAVLTIMFQSAMGQEEFIYFNTHLWKQVKEQLHEEKKVIRIDLPGRKHNNMMPNRNYFTFIGKDAIDKLKAYLEVRGKLVPRSKIDPSKTPLPSLDEAIFINEKWKPLRKQDISTYIKRHATMLGFIKKEYGKLEVRYRIHAHELRDTYRTEWNLTPAKPIVAEFCMGHMIDSNDYNKLFQRPEWVEEQWKLAQPYLNILSENPRDVKVTDINAIVEKRLQERLKESARAKDTEIEKLKSDMANMQANIESIVATRIKMQELYDERQIDLLVKKVEERLRKQADLTKNAEEI